MDYYQVLRVPPNASRKEIEQAYHRLIKEARYDTSINKTLIESAYRILSDTVAKSQYDSRQMFRSKRSVRLEMRKIKQVGIIAWVKRRTLKQLIITLAITLTVAILFYSVRFGYKLKGFTAGDVLYDSMTHERFGRILKVEEDHQFGSQKLDAYQIELDPFIRKFKGSENVVWLTQDTVKARCYKGASR